MRPASGPRVVKKFGGKYRIAGHTLSSDNWRDADGLGVTRLLWLFTGGHLG